MGRQREEEDERETQSVASPVTQFQFILPRSINKVSSTISKQNKLERR